MLTKTNNHDLNVTKTNIHFIKIKPEQTQVPKLTLIISHQALDFTGTNQ